MVHDASIEDLPFEDGAYDFALTVTLDCFLQDIDVAFRELNRILRPNGALIVAFLDHASPLGKVYDQKKQNNRFYADATFRSAAEITDTLERTGFRVVDSCQTVFTLENKKQEIRPGTGRGVFAVVLAVKTGSEQ